MAEVHDYSDAGTRQPLRQQFRALQVPAEPQEVQGFGPELDAELRRTLPGVDELGGNFVQVLLKAPDRFVT
jgi:hypothetical protein